MSASKTMLEWLDQMRAARVSANYISVAARGMSITVRVSPEFFRDVLAELGATLYSLGDGVKQDVDALGCGVQRVTFYGCVTIEAPMRQYALERGGFEWRL